MVRVEYLNLEERCEKLSRLQEAKQCNKDKDFGDRKKETSIQGNIVKSTAPKLTIQKIV